MEKSIQFVVQHMPSHGEYLKQYCPAPAWSGHYPRQTLARRIL